MRGAGLQMPRAKTPQGRFGEETSLRQPAHSSSATACSWLPTETWAGAHVDEMPQRSPAQPGREAQPQPLHHGKTMRFDV